MNRDEKVALLKELKQHKGWKVIEEYLQENIDKQERVILEHVEPEFFNQKYTQWDLEKTKRAFYILLLDAPDKLIEFNTVEEDAKEGDILDNIELQTYGD